MSRRQAREFALQVLFQVDLGQADPDAALAQAFGRELGAEEGAKDLQDKDAQFARNLVTGTWGRRAELDQTIVQYAKDWSVDRMPVVDRNILRMAIYEIRHEEDVPDGVAVDEAVELAKLYSTAESGKFINGILGSVIRGVGQEAAAGESDANA